MSRQAPSLFESQRFGFAEALDMTRLSLLAHAPNYRHWAVAYSGGKDSTATLTVVLHLIATGQIPAPASLTVLLADTRMELPPLMAAALGMLEIVRSKGFTARVVMPSLEKRFMVYVLGRGVPPPSNTFRWCTGHIKVEPMIAAIRSLREETGEKLLMLTGVRVGESEARDARIALSCGKNGAECGQGWFQESAPDDVADTLAPILHWRLCFILDWLSIFAPGHGYPTLDVVTIYGGDQAEEINARTGCMACNLATKDVALDYLITLPQWAHLAPVKELRTLYAWLKQPANRLRKWDERKQDGSLVANPGRMGPITLPARIEGLDRVLDIQRRAHVDLINAEEESRIRELVAAQTWPNGWDGTEMIASTPSDEIMRGGAVQRVMIDLLTSK